MMQNELYTIWYKFLGFESQNYIENLFGVMTSISRHHPKAIKLQTVWEGTEIQKKQKSRTRFGIIFKQLLIFNIKDAKQFFFLIDLENDETVLKLFL